MRRPEPETSSENGLPSGGASPVAGSAGSVAASPAAAAPSELPREIGILPLKSTVLFPGTIAPLTIGRPRSLALLDAVVPAGRWLGCVTQKDATQADPGGDGLYEIGTAASVAWMARKPDGTSRVQVQGIRRFRVRRIVATEPYLRAEIEPVPETAGDPSRVEALRRTALDLFAQLLAEGEQDVPAEVIGALSEVTDPGRLADFVAANVNEPLEGRQTLLETGAVEARLDRVVQILQRELQLQEISLRIRKSAQTSLEKKGREAYLREQLRAIHEELGEHGEAEKIARELAAKIEAAKLPAEAAQTAKDELERLRTLGPGSAEWSVSRTWLEWMAALPWSVSTPDTLDLAAARAILDEDHTGLEKVKQRILEFLAVVKLKGEVKGSILCFAGPPGVGKTSLGKSIARALGRKFVRLSLGGVRDEAEIRGHRRTYVGALPGRILQGLRTAGSRNPVFVLDELDKVGADFRGDPSAALLEVLDPEQNTAFSDHYLEVPFDLSRVLFIATANVLDTIPGPLRDRTEVIQLPGYTEEEKLAIARRHLVSRAAERCGLAADQASFTDAALRRIVRGHTRESGLRNLEREIVAVCRKIARARAEGVQGPVVVDDADVRAYLGPPKFHAEIAGPDAPPGVATGLAWTAAGGEILFVEATRMEGDKSFLLTGQLGDVMKESAQIALSVVRSRAAALGIPADTFRRSEIHLHVPAGAVPKDGPSAGVTMVAALASLLTGRPLPPDLAMTGEITLRGRVLAVGGIKEKVLAAVRAGVRTVLLPAANRDDLEEVDAALRASIGFRFMDTVDDVLEAALGVRPAVAPPELRAQGTPPQEAVAAARRRTP